MPLFISSQGESLVSDIPAGDGKIVDLFVYSAVLPKTQKI
jgi:hypothetical protein